MATTRITNREIISQEIDLARGDTDDDILSFNGTEAILVASGNSSEWTQRVLTNTEWTQRESI